jgi:tetratricopeptide (TPR) repeat protein
VYVRKKEYELAVADLDEAIRLEPHNSDAFLTRGVVWYRKSDRDRAVKDYDEALRLQPGNARALGNRGLVWVETGQYDRAIADYDESIRLDPHDPSTFSNRAKAWEKKGEIDRALADYAEVLRLQPGDEQGRIDRCGVFRRQNQYGLALDELNEGLSTAPENRAILNLRAWILATCPEAAYRDGARAIEDASRACELTEHKDANYIDTLAAAYAEVGKYESAVLWQQLALTDPKFIADYGPKARERLQLYQEGKPYREA